MINTQRAGNVSPTGTRVGGGGMMSDYSCARKCHTCLGVLFTHITPIIMRSTNELYTTVGIPSEMEHKMARTIKKVIVDVLKQM